MRIGLDLDNTIVCYDRLFADLAVEQGLLEPGEADDKTAVRNALRARDREDAWTLLQGLAYGPRMGEAQAFDGALEFLDAARAAGLRLCVISHRSRRPYAGPPYDLHDAVFFDLVRSAPGSVARSIAIANLDLIKGVLSQRARSHLPALPAE